MKHVPRYALVLAALLLAVSVFPVSARSGVLQSPVPTATPTTAPTATPSATPYPVLGTHVVRFGESLFCIGRAYKVDPWAIARQNNVAWPYNVFVNQSLQIPNAPWASIPAGPTCVAQFGSNVPTPTPTPGPTVTPGPTATPGPTPVAPGCRFFHNVVPGDTLYSIANRYGSNIWAIARANHIWNLNLIFAGTRLCIP